MQAWVRARWRSCFTCAVLAATRAVSCKHRSVSCLNPRLQPPARTAAAASTLGRMHPGWDSMSCARCISRATGAGAWRACPLLHAVGCMHGLHNGAHPIARKCRATDINISPSKSTFPEIPGQNPCMNHASPGYEVRGRGRCKMTVLMIVCCGEESGDTRTSPAVPCCHAIMPRRGSEAPGDCGGGFRSFIV